MQNSFIKELSYICSEKENPEIYEILDKIRENIGLKNTLCFGFRFPIIKEHIQTPNNSNVFLYKEKDKQSYIALVRIENELKLFDISKKKEEIKSFYNIFDENSEYFYSLNINKKRQLIDSPDFNRLNNFEIKKEKFTYKRYFDKDSKK